jgi:transglutaminase-like putative cysteine protease/tetratricopeptide (TPR) repeat protein
MAAPSAADGWQKLWRNQNPEARAAFRAVLKQNPSDPQALRGLGLLNLQEDAEVAALQAWRPIYRLTPAHWSATAYWPQLVTLTRRTGRWALLEGAARDVLAAQSAEPSLRASARLALADLAYRAGKLAEAETHWAAMGYVRKWQVIGPFDNVSLSGFEKLFPPEREIDFKKSQTGKDDQTLPWRPLPFVSREGQCAVAESLGDGSPNVFYAATALLSPQDQAVLLRFDPTGASKVFVNGRLVFHDDTYRQQQPLVADPFLIPATLRKGWNTLLIKLADDNTKRAAFALRVTSPSGEALKSLTTDPTQADGRTLTADELPGKRSSPLPTTGSSPSTDTIALLRKQTHDLEAAVALAYHLRQAQEFHAAAEVLKEALKKAPSAGWLHWQLSRALEEDGQLDEARSERELARQQNPRLIHAEMDYLEEQDDALSAADRLRRLKALLKINPESAHTHAALSDVYSELELTGEALKSARESLARAGGPDEIMAQVGLFLMNGRKAEFKSMIANALRAAPNDEMLLSAWTALVSREGKPADATSQYQRLVQVNPTKTHYRIQLAGLYQAAGDLKKAVQTLRAARVQRPQDADLCARLADLHREMGQSKEAIALYRVAIRLAPWQVTLREKLQLLVGERPVVDLAPATPAGPILARIPKAAEAAGASSVVLLDEAREVVYPDYARVMRARRIIKVFDQAAVEMYQQFPLAVGSASERARVESARIIKSDGKVQDVTGGGYGGMVPLPSLAPGDVIDVAYRVEAYPRGGLGRQFWTQWHFSDPTGGPVKLCRYVLITPPDMQFQTRSHGGVPEPTLKDVKGWRVREWRMADVPARKQETLSPGPIDAGIWLDLSTITSWRQIVAWYRDLAQPRCVPDAAIRARAAELTRNAKTDEEKLRALAAFVSREIQYQSTPFRLSAYVPTEGKQVLRERYGDCKDKAALLTALLSTAGIKANMVLLSGRSQGVTPYLPSPRFTHAVAVVQTAKGPLWVDATADQLEFGGFPVECQQVPALVIDEATSDLTTTPALPVERNRFDDTHQVTLGTDDRLSGSYRAAAAGDWGWMLRIVLQRVPEANRDEALRGMASQMVENAHYQSGSLEHLSDPDQPLVLRFKYEVDRYSSAAGNFILARLPWDRMSFAEMESLLANTAREQDVETSLLRGHFVSSVRLELPAGYTPQELQPEVRGESPWGSYRMTYRMQENVLHAESAVKLTPLRVSAKEFPQFLQFLREINKEMRKQLVFKKGE